MPKLRKFREMLGMSRRQLAEASGMSQAAITLLEYGQTYDPKVSTIQRIADAIGVRFDELYDAEYVRAASRERGSRKAE